MRIHIVSDLHADFTDDLLDLPPVECDLHLVLGDGAAPMTHALPIIRKAIKDDTPVIYVPGNHDFYQSRLHPQTFYQDELARGRELGNRLEIQVASNDVVVVGNTRVLATTLWTDFGARPDYMSRKMAMSQSQKGWCGDLPPGARKEFHNDFREIRFGGSGSKNRFTPSQWLTLHAESIDFLRRHVDIDWEGETIVASHMAPHPQSLMPDQQLHDWLYATTDVDFFNRVDLWAHGHIHASRDYEVDGCRILANPRGYPKREGGFENASWDPALIVELERRYAPKISGMAS